MKHTLALLPFLSRVILLSAMHAQPVAGDDLHCASRHTKQLLGKRGLYGGHGKCEARDDLAQAADGAIRDRGLKLRACGVVHVELKLGFVIGSRRVVVARVVVVSV